MDNFLYLLIHWWILRLILCLGYCNNAAMNMGVRIPFQLSVFLSFR